MPQSYSFTHTNRIAIYLVLKPALVLVVLILFTYADFVECCLNQKILQIFPITLLASDFLKTVHWTQKMKYVQFMCRSRVAIFTCEQTTLYQLFGGLGTSLKEYQRHIKWRWKHH